jgi:hypothetical protein
VGLSEKQVREIGLAIGKCYAPDPDSPPGGAPYRCTLLPGHSGQCSSPIYGMIEHDGIAHPGSQIGERLFSPAEEGR